MRLSSAFNTNITYIQNGSPCVFRATVTVNQDASLGIDMVELVKAHIKQNVFTTDTRPFSMDEYEGRAEFKNTLGNIEDHRTVLTFPYKGTGIWVLRELDTSSIVGILSIDMSKHFDCDVQVFSCYTDPNVDMLRSRYAYCHNTARRVPVFATSNGILQGHVATLDNAQNIRGIIVGDDIQIVDPGYVTIKPKGDKVSIVDLLPFITRSGALDGQTLVVSDSKD